MKESKFLKKFYAVTACPKPKVKSIYEAKIDGVGNPSLTKIALQGQSSVPVGHIMSNGTMLGIGIQLQLFVPEGGGITSLQRDYVMVNTHYHGACSSRIVALFLRRADAEKCFKKKDLEPCDERWIKSTIKVLRTIGMDHPHCAPTVVSDRWWLLEPSKWQTKKHLEQAAQMKLAA